MNLVIVIQHMMSQGPIMPQTGIIFRLNRRFIAIFDDIFNAIRVWNTRSPLACNFLLGFAHVEPGMEIDYRIPHNGIHLLIIYCPVASEVTNFISILRIWFPLILFLLLVLLNVQGWDKGMLLSIFVFSFKIFIFHVWVRAEGWLTRGFFMVSVVQSLLRLDSVFEVDIHIKEVWLTDFMLSL